MKPSRETVDSRRSVLALALALSALSVSAAGAEEEYVYKVTKGDTLIGLSGRLLNTSADWPKVARLNRLPNPNHIFPGAALRIPFSLLKITPVTATVTHIEGDVKATGGVQQATPSVLVLGASLAEGAQIVTGKNGYVTLKLQDGLTVRVQSGTQVRLERMRTYAGVGLLESTMKLLAGRVESLVRRSGENTQTRHGVTTPLATLAVRGAEFRVTMDAQDNLTRGEVLEGVVEVAAETARAGAATGAKRLNAGFGSVVDARKFVSDPIFLLAAPDVSKLAKLQERTVLRFPLQAVAGARMYRAQVARDAQFNAVVAEQVSPVADLRVADVADGSYFLRVRAVDVRGLEGRDSTHAFTMKARPQPPLISAPAPKGKVRAAEVEFKWAENTEAAAYHLQISKDASFKSLAFEDKAVKGAQTSVGQLALGDYFWRIASLRRDGDHGPYGDIASFALLAPPAQPEPPAVGDARIAFRWAGEPGQKFEFQLADEIKFTQPLLVRTLDKPEFEAPRPKPGTYFIRYRATDADGFVGPYSSVQTFAVPVPPACLMDSEGRCVSATHGIVGPLP